MAPTKTILARQVPFSCVISSKSVYHDYLKYLGHVVCVSVEVIFAGDPASLACDNIISKRNKVQFNSRCHTKRRQAWDGVSQAFCRYNNDKDLKTCFIMTKLSVMDVVILETRWHLHFLILANIAKLRHEKWVEEIAMSRLNQNGWLVCIRTQILSMEGLHYFRKLFQHA